MASVMTIAEIDPLNVEVFVPVESYGEIIAGTEATVRPEAPVGGSYRAVVAVSDKVFDAASRTFGVRLVLQNPDFELPAGTRCTVKFDPLSPESPESPETSVSAGGEGPQNSSP